MRELRAVTDVLENRTEWRQEQQEERHKPVDLISVSVPLDVSRVVMELSSSVWQTGCSRPLTYHTMTTLALERVIEIHTHRAYDQQPALTTLRYHSETSY